MEREAAVAAAATAATGLLLLAFAVASLRSGSRLRRWYGIDPGDDEAVGSNALVVGATGAGSVALAAAIAFDVPDRVVGTAAVLVAAGLCVALGWLVRYRDRRELLTTPDVDRETARRLGASVILCGALVLPLAPAVWFDAGPALVAGIALGGGVVGLIAFAWAYR